MIIIRCDLCHADTTHQRRRLYLFDGGYQRGGDREPTHRFDICADCFASLALRLHRRGKAPRDGGHGNCHCGSPVVTRARISEDAKGWCGYNYTGGFCRRHADPLISRHVTEPRRRRDQWHQPAGAAA